MSDVIMKAIQEQRLKEMETELVLLRSSQQVINRQMSKISNILQTLVTLLVILKRKGVVTDEEIKEVLSEHANSRANTEKSVAGPVGHGSEGNLESEKRVVPSDNDPTAVHPSGVEPGTVTGSSATHGSASVGTAQ